MTPRPDYAYQSYERVDITTPYPNPWDHFSTPCGDLWCRVDGIASRQRRHRDGAVCSCKVTVKYINPPWIPEHLRELLENTPSEAVLAQGQPRPASLVATMRGAILSMLGLR